MANKRTSILMTYCIHNIVVWCADGLVH